MEVTCKQGGRHRWNENRSRCLDCGREVAEIAEEMEDWLGETEDRVDRMADQMEELKALLEEAAEALDTAGLPDTRDKILAALAELEEEP